MADITERKRADEAEQEAALLAFALDRVRGAAFLTDDEGRFRYVNEEACRILGYTRAELLGLGVSDIDPQFPVQRWADHWRNLKAQQSLTFESRHRTRDGRISAVEISANYFEYGGRPYNLGLARDITERKRAEEALRRSEAYLAEAQRLSHTGSWAYHVASDKYVYASEECCRTFELDPQEGLPTREAFARQIHPEDYDKVHGQYEKSLREKVDTSIEFRVALPSGAVKHIQAIQHPVLNEAGDVVQLVGTTIDITEQKRDEESLRESEANLNRAQEIAHIGSWHLDLPGNSLTWSDEVYRIFGMPRGAPLSYGAFLNRVHPEDREGVDRAWTAALRGAAYDIEHRILVGDEVKWVREKAGVEFDQQGKAVKGIGTVQDITERRLAEARVQEHAAELQASNQALRESEENTRRAFEEIERLKAQLEQQNAYLREEVVEAKAFGDLVGQSAALQQVVSQIDLVAPTDAAVLIQGETGTGKELVAHEIHRRSHRRDKPLVRVNCASVPRDLYESEFFGHAKGAFTGAIKERAGRFETAEGGTLFLDEIAEVPLELQGKLLRVLQEKRYERVGEDRTRQADVRIIAATNRDLKREVEARRFREDLYYRLNVFPIRVAPLRERKDDIPLLAQHFVQWSVTELRCPKARLTHAEVVRLQSYDWPGNIRELRNAIERAVILARGGLLQFDLPIPDTSSVVRAEPRPANDEPGYLTEAQLRQRERENLLSVLEKARWKIRGAEGAAEFLGVKATTLLSRMKAMGIQRPQ